VTARCDVTEPLACGRDGEKRPGHSAGTFYPDGKRGFLGCSQSGEHGRHGTEGRSVQPANRRSCRSERCGRTGQSCTSVPFDVLAEGGANP
jgi:hypothetical protein